MDLRIRFLLTLIRHLMINSAQDVIFIMPGFLRFLMMQRNVKGDLSNASAVLLDQKTLGNVKTISVTFDFVKGPDSPDVAPGEGGGTSSSDSVAWIMFNSNDYGVSYSVGDVYDPDSTTGGLIAKDAAITGQGTYTVSLDFTGVSGGYANSIAFSALGIKDGESLSLAI